MAGVGVAESGAIQKVGSASLEINTKTLEANAVKAATQLNTISQISRNTANVLFAGELIPDEYKDDPDGLVARELITDCLSGTSNGSAHNRLAAIDKGKLRVNKVRVNEGLEQAIRLTSSTDPNVLRNHAKAVGDNARAELQKLEAANGSRMEMDSLRKLIDQEGEAQQELGAVIANQQKSQAAPTPQQ